MVITDVLDVDISVLVSSIGSAVETVVSPV